jgi:hypothetical protein
MCSQHHIYSRPTLELIWFAEYTTNLVLNILKEAVLVVYMQCFHGGEATFLNKLLLTQGLPFKSLKL